MIDLPLCRPPSSTLRLWTPTRVSALHASLLRLPIAERGEANAMSKCHVPWPNWWKHSAVVLLVVIQISPHRPNDTCGGGILIRPQSPATISQPQNMTGMEFVCALRCINYGRLNVTVDLRRYLLGRSKVVKVVTMDDARHHFSPTQAEQRQWVMVAAAWQTVRCEFLSLGSEVRKMGYLKLWVFNANCLVELSNVGFFCGRNLWTRELNFFLSKILEFN